MCLVGCIKPAVGPQTAAPPTVQQQPAQQPEVPAETEAAQAPAEQVDVSEPAPSNPVAAAAVLVPATLEAPATATLVIRVRTAPTWHIYPVDRPVGTAQPTRLELKLPDGVEPAGDWLHPEAAISPGAAEGQLVYEGDFTFRRRLQFTEQTPSGRVEISCQIDYQACDPFLCRPPESLTVQAAAEVVQKP